MAETYGITTNKGGTGKTSLTTNLASAVHLTMPDKKILILDTDGQANSSVAFNKKQNEYTLYDCMIDGIDPKDAIINLRDNLDLLPSSDDMNFLEFEVLTNLKQYPKPFVLLRNVMDKIENQYDYIFIDSPPGMGLIAGNILSVVDHVVIPFVPETFSVKGLMKVVKYIREFQKEQKVKAEIAGVAVMMIDGRSSLHSQLALQARIYCDQKGIRMYNTRIPRTVRFANATAAFGMPAVLADPNNDMVSVYFDLMKEVVGIDG